MRVTDAASEGVWSGGRRALTAGLVLTITLVGFEALAIATVMPVVSEDLGGLGLYGWVFSAFFLGELVGVAFAGRSADRHGPERAFVAALVLFAGGLLGGGLAPSMAVLVAWRAVQGIGAGAILAVAYAAIGRAYPTQLQARMFAIISTAWVLPAISGPAISGAVADAIGWRWVFLGLLPLVALAGVITIPALRALGAPGGAEPADRRVDALVLALGAGLVLGGLSSRSWIAGPALVVIGAVIAGRALKQLMPRGTLRLAPGSPAAITIRGLATFAFFGVDAFVALALHDLRGASATLAGVALSAATLGWVGGAWIQERRVGTIGARTMVCTGMCMIAVGIGGMIAVSQVALPIAVAVAAWGFAGLGMGVAYAPLSLIVLGEAPEGGEGTAASALQLSDTLGIALGTGAAGAVVAAGAVHGNADATALTIAFALCGAIALVAATAARRLPALGVLK